MLVLVFIGLLILQLIFAYRGPASAKGQPMLVVVYEILNPLIEFSTCNEGSGGDY